MKGQLDFPVLTFMTLAVGLVMIGPILLHLFKSIQAPMSSSLANITVGGSEASTAFNSAINPLINMWDEVLIFAFILAILLLLISSFLIDTHPAFIIVYIFIALFCVLFSGNIMSAADNLYGASSPYYVDTLQLTFLNYVRLNFAGLLIGVIVVSGIIMYGKIAFFASSGGGRGGGYR